MENLKLVFPSEEHEQQAIEYINEFKEYNSDCHGTGGLDEGVDNYFEWLEKSRNESQGINLEENRVPGSTFFAIREEDNKIVGTINIRHTLNDCLSREGGHIGYGVRPTERKKGYATEMLRLGLEESRKLGLDKILLTCAKENIGSAKVILNNNGIFENEIQCEEGLTQRYWINL